MKRRSNLRSERYTGSSDGEQGFWPSYADMMSAVALILFFLMLLSYIQNLVTGNDLQNTQELLETTQQTLIATKNEVENAKQELVSVSSELDDAKGLLLTQQIQIDDQKAEIDDQTNTITLQQSQIDAQQSTMSEQEALIASQKVYLAETNQELLKMKNQMQAIAVLRVSILEQIRDNIVKVMGDSSKVRIGENGNIILADGVLFDTASSSIKPASQGVLDQMSKVFTEFLADPENAKYVDSIVISGHTDSTGGAQQNRELATDRANSVLNYLLTGNGGSLGKYASYFCAAGYGQTRPVASNNTEAGRSANRRIEVSIILKDETVLKIVDAYLAVELPTGAKG